MTANFTFYRVLCLTPPDLEEERAAFESAIPPFVEAATMPDGVLFAPASLRPPISAARQGPAIEANIRFCEFVLAVFGETSPDPVFAELAAYALQCVSRPDVNTRAVAMCFRNYPAAAPEVRALRESLAAQPACEVRDFRDAAEFGRIVGNLLARWYEPLKPPPAATA